MAPNLDRNRIPDPESVRQALRMCPTCRTDCVFQRAANEVVTRIGFDGNELTMMCFFEFSTQPLLINLLGASNQFHCFGRNHCLPPSSFRRFSPCSQRRPYAPRRELLLANAVDLTLGLFAAGDFQDHLENLP